MLFSQDLFFLLVGKVGALGLICVWRCALTDAAPADKDLGLEQQVCFARFTLHVVDGVLVLDVGVEAKNHALWISVSSKSYASAMITEVPAGDTRDSQLLIPNGLAMSNLQFGPSRQRSIQTNSRFIDSGGRFASESSAIARNDNHLLAGVHGILRAWMCTVSRF